MRQDWPTEKKVAFLEAIREIDEMFGGGDGQRKAK
jgi:hypothetical protein